MGKGEIKRSLFFLLERLQLPKQERIALIVVFLFVAITLTANLLWEERSVKAPDNHKEVLEEFERKSAASLQKQLEQEAIYAGESKDTESESVTVIVPGEPVNLNTADSGELQRLPGIGSAYAARIIEYREQHGAFTSVDELLRIKGIGEKTLEKLKPLVEI